MHRFTNTPDMEETPETTPAPATSSHGSGNDNRIMITLTLSVIGVLLALAALILTIAGKPSSGSSETVAQPTDLKIAWVNTDTLWGHYDFVEEVKAELTTFEENLQKKYTDQATALQNDYNAYVKKASSYQLSLEEQKKTEERLGQRQQELQMLDAQLSQSLLDEKAARNIEVHDSIVNYIARYNKEKKYTLIFSTAYDQGLLWADPAMDLTKEILDGLNKEYKAWKKP